MCTLSLVSVPMDLTVSWTFLAFSPTALMGGHLSLLLLHHLQDFHRGLSLTCFTFCYARDENALDRENLPHKHPACGQFSSLWWLLWGSRLSTIATGLLMDTHCPQLVRTEAFPTICHIPHIGSCSFDTRTVLWSKLKFFIKYFIKGLSCLKLLSSFSSGNSKFWKHILPR